MLATFNTKSALSAQHSTLDTRRIIEVENRVILR
jgi:hypothetical protein